MFAPLLALALSTQGFDPGPEPLLMQHPTVNATKIVFSFAGDLWEVPRAGGDAIRLTASIGGTNVNPIFSPDGTKIAFSGNYDGNTDVYVMPATGGNPKRLTAHPAPDMALGWTPDGKSVIFQSSMLSNTDYTRLFTVPVDGGVPKALPFPAGVDASMSPDGRHVALVPNPKWELAWKRYRGGQTTPIWIGDLTTSHIKEIPRKNTNDFNPMWIGSSIYYLSDPTGPVGMNKYDLETGEESVVIPGQGFDLKSATAGPGVIAYEKLGSIHLLDLTSGADSTVHVHLTGDFPATRTEVKNLANRVDTSSISPTGKRVVVTARGWVFTVPAAKGDARLLNDEQGVDRKDASWSPDGKTVAYIVDKGSTQQLALYDLSTHQERMLALGDPPADFSGLVWSPDSTKIAYNDNKLALWVIDVATGKNTLIDTGSYRGPITLTPSWSPDSKWMTWARDLPSYVTAVFLHSFDTGKNTQVTDGIANTDHAIFDRSGKYIYFSATTNLGFGMDFEDLESLAVTNTTSNIYAVLLSKDTPNPLQPESDEEKPKDPKTPGKPDAKPAVPCVIDLDGISHRILALPLPKADYRALVAGPEGSFFALSSPPKATPGDFNRSSTLSKFTMSDRKVSTFAEGIVGADVSADGSKILLNGGGLRVVSTDGPMAAPGGALNLSGLQAKIDPLAEWQAMYHQVWRKERMLFYDPGLHGIDSYAMEKRYEPFLAGIRSRDDLNYLFTDMLGELCIGHMFIGGGERPTRPTVAPGLLGADYEFSQGHYRLTRVYDGESWNPGLESPLGSPGVNAKAGEYLLSIDGQPLDDATDIYLLLEGKAGKQVSVRLGPTPDGAGSREATVVPVASEARLRNLSWEEDNRRYVERETGGKGGYVHVPDTGTGGWDAFMRYYYSQIDKDGMIVDDRFNHGGYINDFMVREMEKPLDFYGAARYGNTFRVPVAAIYGPKVMLINEMAGSGGDLFPYLFKSHHIGKLIGHKTWGGELSAFGFQLIDGGSVRAPDDAEFDPATGQYVIDNVGVAPDISVELDPEAWRNGVDVQLQAAVAELKKQMASHPLPKIVKPAYPDKSKIGH